MNFLSARQYEELIRGALLLRRDDYGPKVYETPDGRIVKLFRTKRWWSSSVVYPYSLRFKHNSRALQRRGFRCATVADVFYCHAIRRHGVIYRKLQGVPLDVLLTARNKDADLTFREYAAFIARLHAARVYFRSIHPGNVLRLEGGSFGLIDVGDVRFPRSHLSLSRRMRNFEHLLRSPEFREVLKSYPPGPFIDAYLDAAMLGDERDRLGRALEQRFLTIQAAR